MKKCKLPGVLFLAATIFQPVVVHSQGLVQGQWMLELAGEGPPIVGMLTLQESAHGWVGHVDGGPVSVAIENDSIEIVIDSRDLAGFVFDRRLVGSYSDVTMSGSFTIEGATEDPEPGGKWSATRKAPESAVELAREHPRANRRAGPGRSHCRQSDTEARYRRAL